MHQILFRLGLCPRPIWEVSAAPDLLAGFSGVLLLRKAMGKEGGQGKGRTGGVNWKEKGRGGKGR